MTTSPTTPSVLQRFDLTDRVAVITGGSRGIGRAVAEGFAEMGAKVVIASRKADACEEAAKAIEASGGTALPVPTHMGELDQVARLVETTVAELGGVDVVVNNAANPLAQPIGGLTPEAMQKSYDTNVRGPVLLVQHALDALKASDHAAVINVLTAGIYGLGVTVSLYVSAKAAMMAWTRAMAGELARYEIRVNALCPGTTDTYMIANAPPGFAEAGVDAQLIKRIAQPEELVPAALFLASDASSFMTGQALVVDGGMTTH